MTMLTYNYLGGKYTSLSGRKGDNVRVSNELKNHGGTGYREVLNNNPNRVFALIQPEGETVSCYLSLNGAGYIMLHDYDILQFDEHFPYIGEVQVSVPSGLPCSISVIEMELV